MTACSRQLIPETVASRKFDNALSLLFSDRFRRVQSQQIVPLSEEFPDFANMRGVGLLLLIPVLQKHETSYCDNVEIRLRMLKYATVMPSEVVRTVARQLGCSTKFPRPSLQRMANRDAAKRAARELNIDRSYVSHCWKGRGDLDAQWHALRRALLQMRSSSGVQL